MRYCGNGKGNKHMMFYSDVRDRSHNLNCDHLGAYSQRLLVFVCVPRCIRDIDL